MTWVIILLISFVFISIIAFIIRSRQTHKKHLERLQEEASAAKKQKTSPRKKPRVENRPVAKPVKPKIEPAKPKIEVKPEPLKPTPKVEVKPKVEPKPEPIKPAAPKVEVKPIPEPKPVAEKKPAVKLPKQEFPKFNNARAVEQLGLSQEEADMFISELIEQIDSEIPALEAAVNSEAHEKIESISHMIKGSATSLGSGGVADVLVDFNTYTKEGKDIQVLQAHLAHLKLHLIDLKAQFG